MSRVNCSSFSSSFFLCCSSLLFFFVVLLALCIFLVLLVLLVVIVVVVCLDSDSRIWKRHHHWGSLTVLRTGSLLCADTLFLSFLLQLWLVTLLSVGGLVSFRTFCLFPLQPSPAKMKYGQIHSENTNTTTSEITNNTRAMYAKCSRMLQNHNKGTIMNCVSASLVDSTSSKWIVIFGLVQMWKPGSIIHSTIVPNVGENPWMCKSSASLGLRLILFLGKAQILSTFSVCLAIGLQGIPCPANQNPVPPDMALFTRKNAIPRPSNLWGPAANGNSISPRLTASVWREPSAIPQPINEDGAQELLEGAVMSL